MIDDTVNRAALWIIRVIYESNPAGRAVVACWRRMRGSNP